MLHVFGSSGEWLHKVGSAAQAHPELLGAAGGPAPGGLVLRLVPQATTASAQEPATAEQHPAGPAAPRACEPAPAAAKLCIGGASVVERALPRQSRWASFGLVRSMDKGSFHHNIRRSSALLASDATPDLSRTGPRASNLGIASAGSTNTIASNETPPLSQAHAKPTLNQCIRSGDNHVVGAEQRSAMAGLWSGSSASKRSINDLMSDVPRRLVLLHTALPPSHGVIHRVILEHLFAAIVAVAPCRRSPTVSMRSNR
jgi:hypothetical protein